jgi:hypothetical protein
VPYAAATAIPTDPMRPNPPDGQSRKKGYSIVIALPVAASKRDTVSFAPPLATGPLGRDGMRGTRAVRLARMTP